MGFIIRHIKKKEDGKLPVNRYTYTGNCGRNKRYRYRAEIQY